MADRDLKRLVTQRLGAQKTGARIAARDTHEIISDASHPRLKQALEQGRQTSKTWADRIDQALEEVAGDGDAGADDNPIIEAHAEVARRIRADAKDDTSRNLGVVAGGRLALHYWIAAFGTMHAYGEQLGLSTMARDMGEMVQEAKRADEEHTRIAKAILAG